MKANLWEEPESDLLERCKKGDEEALGELLVAFTPLVRYITREFAEVSRNEMEDLLQEGYISIISAVKGYESARGKFSSYTFSCVRNRMISFIRKNRNKLFLIPLSHETSGTITYPEMPDNCPHLEEELFRGLTCLEATVLDAFLETGSISGAALVLEWPRKRVDNALQRIRRKIVANRDL